jgi:biofilm protein TabA
LDTAWASAALRQPSADLHMILAPLTDSARYEVLGPRIAAGLRYLRAFSDDTPDGRHDIDGDDVFALVSSYHTGPSTEKHFEAHRRYLDIQLVASGRERILHAHAEALDVRVPYTPEKDIVFFEDPPQSSSFLLLPGDIAIFHPRDAHKPGCMAGGRHAVRKVVVKVRL